MEAIQVILAICGGISLVGGAGAVIYKVVRPAVRINERVADLERKSANDFKTMNRLTELNNAQLQAMVSMLNHMIDGNSIKAMKDTRDKLQAILIEK